MAGREIAGTGHMDDALGLKKGWSEYDLLMKKP
jgi:hypothetical protein